MNVADTNSAQLLWRQWRLWESKTEEKMQSLRAQNEPFEVLMKSKSLVEQALMLCTLILTIVVG